MGLEWEQVVIAARDLQDRRGHAADDPDVEVVDDAE